MSSERAKLTDDLAHAYPFAEPGQRRIVRDEQVPGFFLRIGSKSKSWCVQVTVRHGRRSTPLRTLGHVGQISARDARREAQRLIGDLHERPVVTGKGPTLREAWHTYTTTLVRRKRSPKTLRGYAHSITTHCADWLDRPLSRITPEDLVTRHAELTSTSGPYAANRMVAAFRAVYRSARKIRRDLPPPPTDAVAPNRETRRKRALDSRSLPAWFAQLLALKNPVRREFHWLLLLTGSRPDALRRAEWPHIRPWRREWHFPSPKGGEERAFDMPLSLEIVASLRRVREAGEKAHYRNAQQWVFPSSVGCIVDTTEDRADLSHWGSDLRRTYKTLALECGVSELDTMMLQNHMLAGASRGYIVPRALQLHLRAQQAKISRYIAERARRRSP